MSFSCSEDEWSEATRAITSALMKSEKTVVKLKEGSPQYLWSVNSIRAFQIAIALIRREQGVPEKYAFGKEELAPAQAAYASMIARVEKIQPKFAVGTPQHTLTVRRIRAFEIAVDLIQEERNRSN